MSKYKYFNHNHKLLVEYILLSTEKITSILSSDTPISSESISLERTEDRLSVEKPVSTIDDFYKSVEVERSVLVVVGGGTAAMTYLYTLEIEEKYSHILIIGDRGYWGTAAHRLAQPHHILALPHEISHEFIDPAEHDKEYDILPHQPTSAYVHSLDYQSRLVELEKATLSSLHEQGKKVFIADKERVKAITREDRGNFTIETESGRSLTADKIILATGAGPARTLETKLQKHLSSAEAKSRVLNYTDILTPTVQKCKGKTVLVYGGGATAAWAMEVAALTAKPIAWVGRSGFELAIEAGPRVNAIIEKSRSVQVSGLINSISYLPGEKDEEGKLLITVSEKETQPVKYEFTVDYLFNCIGQEPYELNGLPEIIAGSLRKEIAPYLDKNFVTGTACRLGWATPKGDLIIIGAAQGTYYNKDKPTPESLSVSSYLPRSGQVLITIGGVISTVCALTNYMPFSQDPSTGKITVLSLNVNIMNATQLAIFFTASYLDSPSAKINKAIAALIEERSNTDFGLSPKRFAEFLYEHFACPPSSACQIMTQKITPTVKKLEPIKPKENSITPEIIIAPKRSPLGIFDKPLSGHHKTVKKDSFSEAVQLIPEVDDNISLPMIVMVKHSRKSLRKTQEVEVTSTDALVPFI